jgi:MIP family channel proteins
MSSQTSFSTKEDANEFHAPVLARSKSMAARGKFDGVHKVFEKPTLARRAAAEFFAMAMFVWVGTGTAVAASHAQFNGEPEVGFPATIHLPIAIAFGFGITVLAGNLGAYSGGHVNPAVTLALMITRHCDVLDGAVYILSQAVGAIVGSLFVWVCTSQASYVPPANLDIEAIQPGWQDGDIIAAIGSPPFALGADHVQDYVSTANAFFLEFFGTSLLIGTVMMSAVDKRTYTTNAMLAAWPIGFSVMLSHLVIIPFTGCGINPARTFGPAVVNSFAGNNVWQGATGFLAFYVAPFCASVVVGGSMFLFWGGKAPPEPKKL